MTATTEAGTADPTCTALGLDLDAQAIAAADQLVEQFPPITGAALDRVAAAFTSARSLRPPIRQAS